MSNLNQVLSSVNDNQIHFGLKICKQTHENCWKLSKGYTRNIHNHFHPMNDYQNISHALH